MPQSFVINSTLARRYFGDADPIGKRMNLGDAKDPEWYTVVGIVQDTRHESLGAEPYPQMYAVNTQVTSRSMVMVVRTASSPAAMLPAVRSTVAAMDNTLALNNARTMALVMALCRSLRVEAVTRPLKVEALSPWSATVTT